jgi:excisionase family DNA binding protein
MPTLISVHEAAQRLGMSRERVRQLIHQGVLAASRLRVGKGGRTIFVVDEDSLHALLARQRRPGVADQQQP